MPFGAAAHDHSRLNILHYFTRFAGISAGSALGAALWTQAGWHAVVTLGSAASVVALGVRCQHSKAIQDSSGGIRVTTTEQRQCSADDFRLAMSRFPSGVVVVTTEDERGTPYGFTGGSPCSVSLDAPLLLVC